jgi:hypothetical protein
MSSLGTVLNAFIATAVGGICLTDLFKRTRERRSTRAVGSEPDYATNAQHANASHIA